MLQKKAESTRCMATYTLLSRPHAVQSFMQQAEPATIPIERRLTFEPAYEGPLSSDSFCLFAFTR
jgi:hypothetical protein